MAVNSGRKMFTNPAISRVERFDDAFTGAEVASYKGILAKTLYFLAIILVGMGAFFYIHSYFEAQNYTATQMADGYYIYANEAIILFGALIVTLISGLVASFAVKTIPLTGTIYCAGMGYAVTFLSYTYAAAYSGIIGAYYRRNGVFVCVGHCQGRQTVQNGGLHMSAGFAYRRNNLLTYAVACAGKLHCNFHTGDSERTYRHSFCGAGSVAGFGSAAH